MEELETDQGHIRINRVYRRLATCPAMYWDDNEDADSQYLKNHQQCVAKYMEENLGGRLDIHKNAAFWVLGDGESYGNVHPRDAQLSEVVLLLSGLIREKVKKGELFPDQRERIVLSRETFAAMVQECRESWQAAWSKEYREMDDEKVCMLVRRYMEEWMMLCEEGDQLVLYPGAVKQLGYYPQDYRGTGEKANE